MSNEIKNDNSSIDINVPKSKPNRRRKRIILESRIAAINVMLVAGIMLTGSVYFLFFKRDTVSHEENRKLAEFPKFSFDDYFSGKYTEEIANYYDDTVPNRSFFKKKVSNLLSLKGRTYGDGDDAIVFYGPALAPENKSHSEKVTTTAQQATTAPAQTETATTVTTTMPDNKNPAVDNGMISNNIVVVNHRGLMLYGGGMQNGQEYANSLNEYKKALGDNVNVYSMVCPTAVSYYMPENYLNMTASEEDNINNINSFLSNVKPVDVFTALLFHKSEAIYSRTDHHWQPLGAYYAAQKFAETAGVEFAELNDQNYETVTLPGYVGTLYGYTQSADLLNNPEDFIYYIPKAECKTTRYDTSFANGVEGSLTLDPTNMSTSSYYMVFGGDEQITHIETQCKNGRTLVIFKDSYGNALAPVLTSSFENIYVCDIRYFNLNAVSFIQQVGGTDVLFAMNTYSATGQNHNYIESIRTQ